jgi:hypothetical protein
MPPKPGAAQKGGATLSLWDSARPHGPPYDQGARADWGIAPNFNYKVGFITNFWVLIVIKPIFNVFSPFLGVIG